MNSAEIQPPYHPIILVRGDAGTDAGGYLDRDKLNLEVTMHDGRRCGTALIRSRRTA